MLDGTSTPQPFELPALTPSEARWEIRRVSRFRPDHLDLCDRLRRNGWEPYGADEYGKHFRRRTQAMTCLVVVAPGFKRQARQVFDDWLVVTAKDRKAKFPATLDRIVMAWRPDTVSDWGWVDRVLRPLLVSPAQLEWLV